MSIKFQAMYQKKSFKYTSMALFMRNLQSRYYYPHLNLGKLSLGRSNTFSKFMKIVRNTTIPTI